MKKKVYLQFRSLAVTICGIASMLAPGSSLHAQKPDSLTSNFENMIKGREAGVLVSASDNSPGTAFNIIIRGLKSFRGSNEPLIVLDGAVMNPQRMDTFRALIQDDGDYQTALNSLSMLNPLDIESVVYLKDAYSTSQYGSLGGANGVVVIKTKRGNADPKRPDVKWQSEVGFSTLYKEKKMLGKDEYLGYLSQVAPASQILGQNNLQGVNWQKEATRTIDRTMFAPSVAISQKHYVSIAGSAKSSRFFISGNFSDDKGIVNRSEAKMAAFRINYEVKLGKNATLSTNNILTYSVIDLVRGTAPVGTSTATKSMVLSKPLLLSNNLADRDASNFDLIGENYYSWQKDYDDHTNQYRMVSNTNLSIGLFRFLKWNTNMGIDYRDDNRRRWIGATIEQGFEKNSQVGNTALVGFRYTADSYLAFDYYINKQHHITANAGMSFYGDTFKNNVTQSYNFQFPELRGLKPGQGFPDDLGNVSTTPTFNLYRTSTFGYAGSVRAKYTFKDEVSLAAGLRADALDRYNTRLGNMDYYPSVSAKWSVNNSKWLWGGTKSPFSLLDLRASWGRSGAQNVSVLRTIDSYVPSSVAYPLPVDTSINIMRSLGYRVLWKMVNDQVDAGVDVKLLQDRVCLSVNYYNSFATDRLGIYQIGFRGGANLVDGTYSRGKVHNRGVEIGLSALVMKQKDLQWTVGANFTANRNTIVDTGFGYDYTGMSVGTDQAGESLFANTISAGQSVGAFYGFKTAGVVHQQNLPFVPAFFGKRPAVGDVMFLDQDGDMNITNADKTIIGNPNPKVFGGFFTNVTYKNWSFDLMLDYRLGFDVMNLNLLDETYFASGNTNNISQRAFRNAYSPSNPFGSYPGLDGAGQYMITDRLIEDGSFVRISNVRVTYNIPTKGIKWVSRVFVRAAVYNPYVFTKYSGYDPEVNGYTFQYMRYGLDSGSYPSARSYIISIGANF